MNPDEEQAEEITQNCIAVYQDIPQEVNLEKHLKEVEKTIENLDISIAVHEKNNSKTEALGKIKNEMFRLKYEIVEKL